MNIIILTGGKSQRFGSNKSEAKIGTQTLLEYIAQQLNSHDLIVVGAPTSIKVQFTQENPLGGGPSAGIEAGLKLVKSELVGIYAVDAPFSPSFMPALQAQLKSDAVVPLDIEGLPQYLGGLYRSEKVREAVSQFDSVHGLSVRKLFSSLDVDFINVDMPELLMDVDTPADLDRAIELAEGFKK